MRTSGLRLHAVYALAVLAPAAGLGLADWLGAFAGIPDAVRTGAWAGVGLGAAASGIGYAALAALDGRDNARVLAAHLGVTAFRFVAILAVAIPLHRLAGLSAAAVLFAAGAVYFVLSLVEIAVLTRHWSAGAGAGGGGAHG